MFFEDEEYFYTQSQPKTRDLFIRIGEVDPKPQRQNVKIKVAAAS